MAQWQHAPSGGQGGDNRSPSRTPPPGFNVNCRPGGVRFELGHSPHLQAHAVRSNNTALFTPPRTSPRRRRVARCRGTPKSAARTESHESSKYKLGTGDTVDAAVSLAAPHVAAESGCGGEAEACRPTAHECPRTPPPPGGELSTPASPNKQLLRSRVCSRGRVVSGELSPLQDQEEEEQWVETEAPLNALTLAALGISPTIIEESRGRAWPHPPAQTRAFSTAFVGGSVGGTMQSPCGLHMAESSDSGVDRSGSSMDTSPGLLNRVKRCRLR